LVGGTSAVRSHGGKSRKIKAFTLFVVGQGVADTYVSVKEEPKQFPYFVVLNTR